MKIITFNKYKFWRVLAFVEYDFKIKYRSEKINSIDELSRRFDYEKKLTNKSVYSFCRISWKFSL